MQPRIHLTFRLLEVSPSFTMATNLHAHVDVRSGSQSALNAFVTCSDLVAGSFK